MNGIAIDVCNIGKQYHIGAKRERYRALRDIMTNSVKAPIRRVSKLLRGQASAAADLTETFWALNDVSFQIPEGEVVGIIGRNGAGKSTLLKILSRITEPSTGYADIYGRVGALLEVGTGFHPELTGRENIYLNGAVLGMRRAEITRKFDEIVAFAEVDQFVDTPVKHYSSGMALRLGFSVAAHLEPEILLVDEVLAVGDLAFQKKCLGKMDEVARSGRTVLLVSHNMAAIANLCTSTVLLHRGKLVNYGATADIIDQYVNLTEFEQEAGEVLSHSRHVQNVTLLSERGEPASHFMLGEPLSVEVTLKNADQIAAPVVSLFICNHYGDRLMMLGTRIQADLKIPSTSNVRLRVTTDPVNLLPGLYTLDIGVGSGFDLAEYLQGITSFTIEYADVFNTGKLPSTKQGVIAQKAVWEIL